ncbi:unnamed protein product [Nesidiocoris tenuis]|uniref:PHD-type domain-containing protein n=1 Tax=Nesidiocoris tenuis TaxID=355587 RepID=A0A6H5G153_9HEMI|nr:unnamed protein product [Nesidiocoris tenuis]
MEQNCAWCQSATDDGVECSVCDQFFHAACTRLGAVDKWTRKSTERRNTWKCDACASPHAENAKITRLTRLIEGLRSDLTQVVHENTDLKARVTALEQALQDGAGALPPPTTPEAFKHADKIPQYMENEIIKVPQHSEFDLYTDHKALTAISDLAKNGGRMARWITQFMPFRYVAHHIKGKDNTFSDYLSRYPVDAEVKVHPPATPPPCDSLNILHRTGHLRILKDFPDIFIDFDASQMSDPELEPIIKSLRDGSNAHPNYILKRNRLYRVLNNGQHRAVVPSALVDTIIRYYHFFEIRFTLGNTADIPAHPEIFFLEKYAPVHTEPNPRLRSMSEN